MADIGRVFTGMLQRLPPAEQQLFGSLITPEFTQRLHQVNPQFAEQLSTLYKAPTQTAAAVPATPAQPVATMPQAPAQPAPQVTAQPAPPIPVEQKTNFADGGVIERGQAPSDPMAPAAPAGMADDLQRNVSDGEYVVPSDIVKKKGTEFFDKLIESVRTAESKRAEEEAAAKAAQGQGQQAPMSVPPAPPGNEQPTTTGPLSLPQGTGSARKPIL